MHISVVLHVTWRLGTNALDVAARSSKADTAAAPAGRNLAHRAKALPPRHSGQSVDGDDEQDGRGRLRRIDGWFMPFFYEYKEGASRHGAGNTAVMRWGNKWERDGKMGSGK